MGLRISSEEEFNQFLKLNPALKVSKTGQRPVKQPIPVSAVPVRRKETQKPQTPEAPFVSNEKNKKARSKYWNTKVYVYADGVILYGEKKSGSKDKPIEVYDSIREYKRWIELCALQKSGEVARLERQKKLVIQEAFQYQNETIREISYKADFTYKRGEDDVVEDVKGYDSKTGKFRTTTDFKLKWKLLKNRYPDLSFEIHN